MTLFKTLGDQWRLVRKYIIYIICEKNSVTLHIFSIGVFLNHMIMYDYVYCILVKTFKTDLLNQTRAKKTLHRENHMIRPGTLMNKSKSARFSSIELCQKIIKWNGSKLICTMISMDESSIQCTYSESKWNSGNC